jgi:isoamylase
MDKKVFYEIHVEGGTKLCPHVPEKDRGKFLGICSPFMIEHMKRLGVTTVQLMPIFDSEGTYWGYDPTSWFSLNPRYGTAREFNTMLDTLHENGLEVILDVVYNHVSNGSRKAFERLGVSFYDWDVTGCGNTVDVQKSLPVIMRSIRYWLEVVGVDGMRFDLANVLGREGGEFNPNAEFFAELSHYQDKILVAEPWDCTSYSLGKFPEWMLELNDQSRETLRNGTTYWCDHLDWKRSVNFITCHDGLTLYDLTSGWPEASNMQANFKTSSYHRLLLAGDEFGNSQNGNDNAYLLGNEESWLNW